MNAAVRSPLGMGRGLRPAEVRSAQTRRSRITTAVSACGWQIGRRRPTRGGRVAALLGSNRYRGELRFLALEVPYLAGVDLRGLAWWERLGRCPRLQTALWPSPLVEPSRSLVEQMEDGTLKGIVLNHRESVYGDGSRRGWSKVKHPSWHGRGARRFDRRA